jgi:hypothetical protein
MQGVARTRLMSQQLFPYVAILIFSTTRGESASRPLYSENIVLLRTASEEQARKAAVEWARRETGSYQNVYGETVTWKLEQAVDVSRALDDELSGEADLYTRHFRYYDSYQRFEPLLSGETCDIPVHVGAGVVGSPHRTYCFRVRQ